MKRHYRAFALAATYAAPLSASLIRQLLRDRPDLFFSQDYANGLFDLLVLASRLSRAPLIAYHSGSFPDGYLARWTKRYTIRRADLLLVASHSERQRLIREFGVSPGRIRPFLALVDTRVIQPLSREQACSECGLDPRLRRFLFVGRLDDSVKRTRLVIRAFARVVHDHPSTELVIAGDGPDHRALVHLARKTAPGRVRFVGWVDGTQDKAALYSAADALVLASRSEGMPTVVAESFACGTPVIATAVGAIPEVVRPGETGWLVSPDPDDAVESGVAAVMSEVLSSGPDAGMREAARRLALTEFDTEVQGARLGEEVLGLVAGRRRRWG